MKILSCLLLSLVAACLLVPSQGMDVGVVERRDGSEALMVEYISEYKVKTNDLSDVIKYQLSNVTIGLVQTAYAVIEKSSFLFNYKNTSVVTYVTPTKVVVANDSYAFSVNFSVTVFHTIGSKTYHCWYAPEDLVTVNYTKEVNLQTGNTVVSSFSSSFGPKTFAGDATCTEKKQSDKDKVRIHEIVSGTESSSIYLELKKTLSKMPADMQTNAQSEHLSQIYGTSPYNYTYYSNFSMLVDVSTVDVKKFGEKGIVNKMKGTIAGASHFVQSLPSYQQGYNLFFTKQFIQNMIDYSLVNYKGWQGIRANRTNMRIDFRFRLIDYEYIVPNLLKKYPQLYLADTQIECSVLSYKNFQMFENYNISMEFTWSCVGSVMVSDTSKYVFLNFEPTILYQVTVDVRSLLYLTVYEKAKKVVNLNFNIIDDNYIQDINMVKLVIESGLFEFQGYPIGGFFKVKSTSSMVKIAQEGVWVG